MRDGEGKRERKRRQMGCGRRMLISASAAGLECHCAVERESAMTGSGVGTEGGEQKKDQKMMRNRLAQKRRPQQVKRREGGLAQRGNRMRYRHEVRGRVRSNRGLCSVGELSLVGLARFCIAHCFCEVQNGDLNSGVVCDSKEQLFQRRHCMTIKDAR